MHSVDHVCRERGEENQGRRAVISPYHPPSFCRNCVRIHPIHWNDRNADNQEAIIPYLHIWIARQYLDNLNVYHISRRFALVWYA